MTRCNEVRNILRRAWLKDSERRKCLIKGRRMAELKGKHRFEYQCAKCQGWFVQKEIQIDHIKPCGTFTKQGDIKQFVYNLFFGKLQKLCKVCHKKKSKFEGKMKKDKIQSMSDSIDEIELHNVGMTGDPHGTDIDGTCMECKSRNRDCPKGRYSKKSKEEKSK